jgi:hypothetical protein
LRGQLQFTHLLLTHRSRRIHHQVDRLRRLRERNHLAQALRPGQDHRNAVEPERDAAVRWRAVLQRVQEESEARLRLFVDMPSDRKISACTSFRWIRIEPEPSSVPFSTMSYASARTALIAGQPPGLEIVLMRRGERMVRAFHTFVSSSHSYKGKSVTQRNL